MRKVISLFPVDDDVDDQDIFIMVLREVHATINCTIAFSGGEAMAILTGGLPQVPDYIFVDLNMPKLNGRQFLTAIKSIGILKNIPIIVYTTASGIKDKEEQLNLGAGYFFTKPDHPASLKEELEYVLINGIG